MIDVIKEFFGTLLGGALPDSVSTILGFALCSMLFESFFMILGLKHKKVWRFAIYICIVVIAVLAIADSTNLALTIGGA